MPAAAAAANRLAIDGLTRSNPIRADPTRLGTARGTRIRPKTLHNFYGNLQLSRFCTLVT